MVRVLRRSAVPIALVVVASACGGHAKVTKASYVKAANAICTTMDADVAALGDPGSDLHKSADVADRTASITADALRKLRALRAPDGDKATVDAIYAKVDVFLHDAPAVSARLRAGDSAGATDAEQRLESDLGVANAAALDYGLTVCGS